MSEKETRERAEQVWEEAWMKCSGPTYFTARERSIDVIAAALAEKDREIERLRKIIGPKGLWHLVTRAERAETDRDLWKTRAEERDKAFRRALELQNDCRAEKCPTYIRLPQKGCECETCNLFRAVLEDER